MIDEAPMGQNNELISDWMTIAAAVKEEEDGSLDDALVAFLTAIDHPNWVCFEICSQGLPVSGCWIVIDMDYKVI